MAMVLAFSWRKWSSKIGRNTNCLKSSLRLYINTSLFWLTWDNQQTEDWISIGHLLHKRNKILWQAVTVSWMWRNCEHDTESGFPFMCSPAVTEKYADAPDVAVGGGAEPGDQPRFQKQWVQARAAIIKQAEKMAGLDEQDKTDLRTRTNGPRVHSKQHGRLS